MESNLPRIITFLRPAYRNRKYAEAAFTLIEIMIVATIVAILAAVAIPITSQQIRAAVISGVQSDVSQNRMTMLDTHGALYRTVDDFNSTMHPSDGNQFFYAVNTERNVACLQVAHIFEEGDFVSYFFLTSDGKMKEGACPDMNPDAPEPPILDPEEAPEPEEEEVPEPDQNLGGSGPVEALTQMPGLKFTHTYSPQNNSLNFCYNVTVSIDGSYAGNSPTIPDYNWEYKIDISGGPWWGFNPATGLNSAWGFSTKSIVGNIWTIKGEGWNDKINGSSGNRSLGMCSSSIPVPPHDPTAYTYSVELASGASDWWACVNIVVTSTSPWPVPWEFKVDLKDHFRSIVGKDPQFSNIFDRQHLGDSVYDVTGAGWNKYVSITMPRTNSNQICYNPNGQPY